MRPDKADHEYQEAEDELKQFAQVCIHPFEAIIKLQLVK